MSTLSQRAIQQVVNEAAPYELYKLALTVRDSYKAMVRDNGMKLDPAMLRTMNENVEFYRKQIS
jgi:hypothetical protein